jgi:penicillin amidase
MDTFMRSLSLHIAAKEFANYITTEQRETMQAYADGINAYVAQSTILPMEFWLTRTTFEPWKLEHTCMLAKLMEFHLSISQVMKAIKTYIAEEIGTEFLKEILQVSPEYQFLDTIMTVINEEDIKTNGLLRTEPHDTEFTRKNLRNGTRPHINLTPPRTMSDSWAIIGRYTKSGKPLLANDPHLTHKLPGTWYYQILKFPNETVVGVGLPGIPPIVIGRNTHVAWGITASGIENVDMYWLDVNEKNKTYYYNNTWIPFKIRKETIKVKNGEKVEIECYSTHHGPAIMKTPIEASSIYM